MRKVILVMLVVGCSLGITDSAFAKAYLAANVAYVELNDEVITDSSASGLNGAEISFYGGQGVFLAVGSDLKGFRYEGELSYTKAEMDSIAGAFGGSATCALGSSWAELPASPHAWT